MARIVVSTDDGEIMEIFADGEIGDLDKSEARTNLMDQIRKWVDMARKRDYSNVTPGYPGYVAKVKKKRKKPPID